jgi:hypothetical protein
MKPETGRRPFPVGTVPPENRNPIPRSFGREFLDFQEFHLGFELDYRKWNMTEEANRNFLRLANDFSPII